MGKLISRRYLALGGLMALTLLNSGCGPGGTLAINCNIFYSIQVARQSIGVGEKVPINLLVNNPCNHNLEFRFIANRGQLLSQNPSFPSAEYVAPFTGGEDMITVAVFNRTDSVNLPQQQRPLLVLGDGLSYVEAPAAGTVLDEFDNGVIKVAGVQGTGGTGSPPRQVAIGRQPVISPDGRYIAYTYFPGDGTSQIRMQDTAGNVTILSGNTTSFNRDPSWAPIGNDRTLNLLYSSDRLSDSTGTGVEGRGSDYNIWRVNVQGQNPRQLASTPGLDREPVWSPDGQFVLYRSNFSQNKVNNFDNLWRMEQTTGRLLQLTYETAPQKGAFEPAFSPDGGRVVYTRKYLSRQPQSLYDFQKIWLINLAQIDIPSLLPFIPGAPGQPALPTVPGGPVPDPVLLNPAIPGSVNTLNGNFGNVATQEFDEGTVESSPSFSVDGRWITYVQKRGDDVRALSVPGNPGNLGTIGFQPLNVLPSGAERALELRWARQTQSFNRF
jgi:Tol biopolymer transport system component